MPKPNKVLVQLGNPGDTNGANLVEAYIINDSMIITVCSDNKLIFGWGDFSKPKELGSRDFEEARYYCTDARGGHPKYGAKYLYEEELPLTKPYINEQQEILEIYNDLKIIKTTKR